MEPTLKDGQIVWVNNWHFLINKVMIGDIVVFQQRDQEFLKRVSKIGKNGVFVAGDNSTDSLDSRRFGEITFKQIRGKIYSK